MTVERRPIERRPSAARSNIAYPKEWGKVPSDPSVVAMWIKRNVRDGEHRARLGESVPWIRLREDR